MKKYLKSVLAPLILVATVAAFVYYIRKHPDTLTELVHVPAEAIVLLLALYAVAFFAYVLITRGSLRIYDKHMGWQENFLFNAYSSLINFFGPGQSGPIFRGAYLKKRHNLGVKPFVFTMLLYYGFYAVISIMFMLVGSRPWWQTVLLMLMVGAGSWGIIRRYKRRAQIQTASLDLAHVGWIFGATAVQILALAVIYGIELHAAGAHAGLGQILSYTGVANFSLFVAITPGAIGIREAFLAFSQNLHHIDSGTIVAANVLDRGVYLVFLGLLFVFVLGLHARKKLGVSKLTEKTE